MKYRGRFTIWKWFNLRLLKYPFTFVYGYWNKRNSKELNLDNASNLLKNFQQMLLSLIGSIILEHQYPTVRSRTIFLTCFTHFGGFLASDNIFLLFSLFLYFDFQSVILSILVTFSISSGHFFLGLSLLYGHNWIHSSILLIFLLGFSS